MRQRLRQRYRALRIVLVSASAREDLLQQRARDIAGHQIAVERIDEAVGLSVITKTGLLRGRREARPPCQKRRQLVTDLLAQRAKATGEHVAQIGLKDKFV